MNKPRLRGIVLSGAIALASCALATNAFAAGHGGGGGGHDGGGGGGHEGGGGHFGGGHFGGGGSFARHLGSEEDWTDDYYNREDCWQVERVPTQTGWRLREVWVCD